MNWEPHVCLNQSCDSETWVVQPDLEYADVWHVAVPGGFGAWTVAATEPLCPHCGTTLAAVLEFAEIESEEYA